MYAGLGYNAWKKDHGRQVRKGEKGIKIIAPCKYKVELDEQDENGNQKVAEYTGFKVATVFDYAQTEGKELPSIGVNELTGDVTDYRNLFNALTEMCPVPIYTEDIQGGAKGYYSDADKKIVVKSDMSQLSCKGAFEYGSTIRQEDKRGRGREHSIYDMSALRT